MKVEVLPALIIAAAILGSALIFHHSLSTSAGAQIDSVLSQLEVAGQARDGTGSTRVQRIITGLSRSIGDGVKAGISSGQKPGEESEARDKLEISEVKILPGGMKSQERIIGIVRNRGTKSVSNIQLNVVARGRNGELLDVVSNFANVNGTLKPNEELGFEVSRQLGDFKESDPVLEQRRSASAKVAVVSCVIAN